MKSVLNQYWETEGKIGLNLMRDLFSFLSLSAPHLLYMERSQKGRDLL